MRCRRIRFLPARFQLLLIWSAFSLILAGCGDGKLRTYPVTGTVKVDGKPAEGAVVIFCPSGGSDELKRERPMGVADAGGKFELKTFIAHDGAPAGDYKVMIRWPAPKKGAAANDERATGGFDVLNGKYFNPEQSGLIAKVAEGPTDLPPYELKSK